MQQAQRDDEYGWPIRKYDYLISPSRQWMSLFSDHPFNGLHREPKRDLFSIVKPGGHAVATGDKRAQAAQRGGKSLKNVAPNGERSDALPGKKAGLGSARGRKFLELANTASRRSASHQVDEQEGRIRPADPSRRDPQAPGGEDRAAVEAGQSSRQCEEGVDASYGDRKGGSAGASSRERKRRSAAGGKDDRAETRHVKSRHKGGHGGTARGGLGGSGCAEQREAPIEAEPAPTGGPWSAGHGGATLCPADTESADCVWESGARPAPISGGSQMLHCHGGQMPHGHGGSDDLVASGDGSGGSRTHPYHPHDTASVFLAQPVDRGAIGGSGAWLPEGERERERTAAGVACAGAAAAVVTQPISDHLQFVQFLLQQEDPELKELLTARAVQFQQRLSSEASLR